MEDAIEIATAAAKIVKLFITVPALLVLHDQRRDDSDNMLLLTTRET
jgi:hypothetical protein